MADIVVVGGGISGLATAYSIQEMAKQTGLQIKLTLIEKEGRVGGKVLSIKENGFLCESGPPGFLDNRPETLKLSREVGLKTLPCSGEAKKRFIYTDGKLHLVPMSPLGFLASGILSISGRLRVLMEPFTKPAQEEDETIANFARRHLGKEAEEKLISAMVAGIHAGDSEKLSVKSCFPVMLELEREGNGSLLKAMMKRMRAAKKGSKKKATPTGNLTSFKEGMAAFTEALRSNLEAEVLTGKTAKSVSKVGSGYEVLIEGEENPLKADAMVLALPAYAAAEVLKALDEKFSEKIAGIPYAPATVVCLGYRKKDVQHSLDGFGFLIPKREDRGILGCRWDSSTFKHRAPARHALVEVIVGGATNPDAALLEDNALLELVKGELKDILGVTKDPVFVKIFRHEKAIPQYVVSHGKRLDDVEEILKLYPGLFITGNAFKGIGINDCTRNAPIIAKQVVDFVKGRGAS